MNHISREVFTVGHSNHTIDHLIKLLKTHSISAVADVRSSPYSRFHPQFNRENLHEALRAAGIAYVYLGRELGARTDDANCYDAGRVSYSRLARTASFQNGLQRLYRGMGSHRISMLCAEKDPLACHRTILVCRELARGGVKVHHIIEDGNLESHNDALGRLLRLFDLQEDDLFRTYDERLDEAYRLQEERIAYANPEMVET